jgi:hypothetical protein
MFFGNVGKRESYKAQACRPGAILLKSKQFATDGPDPETAKRRRANKKIL